MTAVYPSTGSRPAPVRHRNLWRWSRRNLFDGPVSTLQTLLVGGFAIWALSHASAWALLHAVWAADESACQAARGLGACWGVVAEKFRSIVFGRYPFDLQWRPLMATVLLCLMLLCSSVRAMWRWWLALVWLVCLSAFLVLMGGGLFGLSRIGTDRWGGFPLTLMLATISIALAFPIAVVIALGRRSKMPAIRTLCMMYVELLRGVPLVSVLFMASFMFPLLVPPGISPDVLLRVLVAFTLFAAAYVSEIVRGGLQAVPSGQFEAAASVGLSWWETQRLIVLPQALSMIVPALVNNFIASFKDTSLITIVSLYELTGALNLALNGDPIWQPYKIEGYLFISAIYFATCFTMSRYSIWVERRLNRSKR